MEATLLQSLSYRAFLDVVDVVGGFVVLGTHGESFNSIERFLVVVIFKLLEHRADDTRLLLAIKHATVCDSNRGIIDRMGECLTIFDPTGYVSRALSQISKDMDAFAWVVSVVLLCILTQILMFGAASVNARRKIFHFFVFFVFHREYEISVTLAQGLLLLLGILSSSSGVNMFFRSFFSRHDRGRTILSHVYLVSACVYPGFFIAHEEYVATLISVCFVDLMASVVGELLETKSKSLWGTASGILSGTLVYIGIYGSVDMLPYFVFAGLVEYSSPVNDNISIPLLSVLYFRYLRRTCLSDDSCLGTSTL